MKIVEEKNITNETETFQLLNVCNTVTSTALFPILYFGFWLSIYMGKSNSVSIVCYLFQSTLVAMKR